jgi:hypothetical protein
MGDGIGQGFTGLLIFAALSFIVALGLGIWKLYDLIF